MTLQPVHPACWFVLLAFMELAAPVRDSRLLASHRRARAVDPPRHRYGAVWRILVCLLQSYDDRRGTHAFQRLSPLPHPSPPQLPPSPNLNRKGAAGGRAGGGDVPGPSTRAPAAATAALAFAPIGVCRSCFSRRNGTPRQPLLVRW